MLRQFAIYIVILHRQFHKIAILYIRIVERIKTEKSEPPGETAKHGICDETHIIGGFIVHALQLIALRQTGRLLDITLLMSGETPDLSFRALYEEGAPRVLVLLFRYGFRGGECLKFPFHKGVAILLHP